METFAAYMKTDWVIVAEICQERNIDMDVIVRPEKHRDDASVAKRSCVLRAARRNGITIGSLTTLCPMTERGIRKMIGNATNSSEPVPNSVIGGNAE